MRFLNWLKSQTTIMTTFLIYFFINVHIVTIFGKSIETSHFATENQLFTSTETTNTEFKETRTQNCTIQQLNPEDVTIHKNGNLFIKAYKITVPSSRSHIIHESLNICFERSELLNKEILNHCDKWMYNEDEYTVLDNDTVRLYDDVLEPGTFELREGKLLMCATEQDYIDDNSNVTGIISPGISIGTASIYIGKIGSSLSIIALTAHLIAFCLVPTLRNLPGYNLASLSIAFLFGYSFSLIGQIPEVLGLFCVVSGVLQQNFFLVAFFCMNTLAFDVWRTLKMATTKLMISSQNAKRRQFIFYSIYSWGIPLIITIISVVIDNTDGAPEWIRPYFGKDDTCWMTNDTAKNIFFVFPAFTLFLINVIYFILSAFIIKKNTMKSTNDEMKQTARLDFVLYFRLGLMMGLTWTIGVLAPLTGIKAVWLVFDILNSLQGLFVFLLFTCSRKVFKNLSETLHLKSVIKSPKTSTTDNIMKT